MPNDNPAVKFDHVFEVERDEIRMSRKVRLGKEKGGDYSGLALSGGGIRSATFNLGVLQALAEGKILRRMDYLSTVSGGGYIGSWLIAWLKRKSFDEVERELIPDWNKHHERATPQIEFLRDYSNYLTPQLGFLSADTWAAIAIFSRNLLLNLMILISLFTAVALVPYVLVPGPWLCHSQLNWIQPFGLIPLVVVGALLVFTATVWLAWNLWQIWSGSGQKGEDQARILTWIVAPLIGASWAGCSLLSMNPNLLSWKVPFWVPMGMLAVDLCVWLILGRGPALPKWLVLGVGVALHLLLSLIANWWILAMVFSHWKQWPGFDYKVLAWGIPISLLVTLIAGAIQVGLAGLLFPNELREWTGRLGGWILIIALAWAALFGVVFYSPLLAIWAGMWIGGAVTLGWLIHTLSGVLSAFSSKTGEGGAGGWMEILAQTAPPIFVAGLFILLSLGIYKSVSPSISTPKKSTAISVSVAWTTPSASASTSIETSGDQAESFSELASRYWNSMRDKQGRSWLYFGLALITFLTAILVSMRVDVNDFSLHLAYRNRLVRCYLGASRPSQFDITDPCRRTPNPFTGFDANDDLYLASFAVHSDAHAERSACNQGEYHGPYPIINATLSLTHGERLAWQERKAESYTFTPRFCGGTQNDTDAYRPTASYAYPGGPYLGTAFSISGAAVSPDLGYHISPAVGFLMTIFNVRLDQWLPNPSQKKWKGPGPRLGLIYLLKELFGFMDDESAYVCLSDGGHFEDLGVYELVRRKCRYIIVGDAGCDPDLTFEDLGNAIRKCWTDFGATIQIDVSKIRIDQKTGHSQAHSAAGSIQYADGSEGKIVYLKASLTGDEPTDVLEYSSQHAEFPHQTTADQWFDESQFESYRKLGYHIATKALSLMPPGVYS